MLKQTAYIRKDVRNGLPDTVGEYFAETTLVDKIVVSFNEDGNDRPYFSGDLRGDAAAPEEVTHFYEPKEGYFLTEEQLIELIGKVWDDSMKRLTQCEMVLEHGGMPTALPKEQYIKELLK